jgi:hypothetical protein
MLTSKELLIASGRLALSWLTLSPPGSPWLLGAPRGSWGLPGAPGGSFSYINPGVAGGISKDIVNDVGLFDLRIEQFY